MVLTYFPWCPIKSDSIANYSQYLGTKITAESVWLALDDFSPFEKFYFCCEQLKAFKAAIGFTWLKKLLYACFSWPSSKINRSDSSVTAKPRSKITSKHLGGILHDTLNFYSSVKAGAVFLVLSNFWQSCDEQKNLTCNTTFFSRTILPWRNLWQSPASTIEDI